ncbi:MAG: FtsH protease activity modulator HflK [Rhodospirillales bacterium]|nr:FtsH protease activity modulator HflK [Rhodospirillales bacterium]
MAGQNGGPWGGGNRGGDGDGGRGGDGDRPPRRPGEGTPLPEIDQLVNRGREQLRVLMGGGGGRRPGGPGGSGSGGPQLTRGTLIIAALVVIGLWSLMSVYTVKPEERSVEMFLGSFYSEGDPGLNFAPWPVVTYEVVNVTSERTESIGSSGTMGDNAGLMLTTDANLVDIGFQVVWNINDPAKYLFNIRDPELTVRAAAESVMREIIASTRLQPILNVDRGVIADRAHAGTQEALDAYESGITVVRVNLQRADPPLDVIDSFRAVQAAEQERDRLERQADAYSNRVVAAARGQAAQVTEEAAAYRARIVNDALGQASRFTSVLTEYLRAPEVTRRRLYLEAMEDVLGGIDKIVFDPAVSGGATGGGVLPLLSLDQLSQRNAGSGAAAETTTSGTGN